ncbi:cholecystokinin receptor-like, partial [Actinia tenebrosa]|uniref:Cholecystokinin receptor-like n=1 Tax=Actinia tenebrosa TaxID=6105 RepID=A0A6P8GZ93_ACTTE
MDNYSLFTNTTRHQDERMADDTKVVLYSILLVWSLIGNVLVIAVVFSNDIKTIFNGLIVNMAVSDLFVPLLALPLKIVESSRGRYNEWLVEGPLGETLCKLCYFFIDISPAVSVFSLIIIAVNRFVAIVFPSSLKRWSGKIQRVLLMFTWVFSMALLSPYFYTFRLKHINGLTYCLSTWSPAFEDIPARTLFISILIVAVFLIPFLTITVLYVMMLKKLIQHSKTVENSFN